jgi:hypothetical protein
LRIEFIARDSDVATQVFDSSRELLSIRTKLMGLETKCTCRSDGKEHIGKLHLDSNEITYSAPGFRWKASLTPPLKANVSGEWLQVGSGKNIIAFEVGQKADAWLSKILQPPNRSKKLGLKPEMKCCLVGRFDVDFVRELELAGIQLGTQTNGCDVAIVLLEAQKDFKKLEQTIEGVPAKTNVWIVWPKGVNLISQEDVLTFAADRGMGPSKACSFDARLTAMRFMKK